MATRRLNLHLPEPKRHGLEWPELESARAELDRLAELLTEAREELRRREEERQEAAELDHRLRIKAVREGTEPPPQSALEANEAAIREAAGRVQVVEDALVEAEREAAALIDAQRGHWAASVAAAAEGAREKTRRALDALARAEGQLAELEMLGAWLARFNLASPAAFRSAEGTSLLRSMKKPSGQRYRVGEVIDALRERTEPAEPGPPGGQVHQLIARGIARGAV